MASQSLVQPFFVQFNSTSKEDDTTLKAFAFQVFKVDDDEHYSGAVWCADLDNNAGLAPGWNERSQIGKGKPGDNVSWSPLD